MQLSAIILLLLPSSTYGNAFRTPTITASLAPQSAYTAPSTPSSFYNIPAPCVPSLDPTTPPEKILELRDIAATATSSAPITTTQAPSVTVQWLESIQDSGATTWVEFIYTQVFDAVPTPPPPERGSIGLGTLTGSVGAVRTAEARQANAAAGLRRGVDTCWKRCGVLVGLLGALFLWA